MSLGGGTGPAPFSGAPYTTGGGGQYSPSPSGGGTLTQGGQTYIIEAGGPRGQSGYEGRGSPQIAPTSPYTGANISGISYGAPQIFTPQPMRVLAEYMTGNQMQMPYVYASPTAAQIQATPHYTPPPALTFVPFGYTPPPPTRGPQVQYIT